MAIRYAVQHHTTRAFLVLRPSLGVGHQETSVEADACSFKTMTEATWELLELGDFAGAWEVVPVTVAMSEDEVSVEVRERKRREAGEFRA